jgi:polar amino acid transport system substrate-binding protein
MMKSRKRVLASIIALMIVIASVLSACGKANSDVLRVGVDDSYPPMEYKDKDGKTTIGFDVDVAKELGKRLDKKDVQFIPNDWTGIFNALETNKFDVIISSVSINDERQKAHSLTNAYIANKQVIVTKAGTTDITKPEDLKGKKVGFQAGTTSEEFCKETLKLDEDKLSPYPLVTQPFMDLEAGRIDAIMVDVVVAKYYIANNKEKFIQAWQSDEAEPMAFCFPKKDAELRDKVNKILEEMQNDGTMKTISEKWFGEDITKNLK